MDPSDIELLTALSRPALAPDASFAVLAASRPDLRADRAVGQLWRIDLTSGTPSPRRLTRGIADAAPRISPDGSTVAFLRPDARGRRQLHLVDARGGEPLRLTDQLLGVDAVRWLPDGVHLAFTARVAEPGRYGSVEGLEPAAEPSRRVTGVRWLANGTGHVLDRPAQVHLVPATPTDGEPLYPAAPHPGGELAPTPEVPAPSRQLTDAAAEHGPLVPSADGSALLVVREAYEDSRRDLRTELLTVPLDGAEPRVLLSREDGLRIHDLAVLADDTLALLASQPADGRDGVAPDIALWLLEDDGPRRLTDPEQLEIVAPLVADGDAVLVAAPRRGRVHLLRVGRDGAVTTVLDGELEAQQVAAVDGAVLATVSAPDSAGALLDVREGAAPRVVWDPHEELRGSGLARPRELEISGRSGYPVHGWVTLPAGDGPFPTVLMIHGGPHAAYGVSVFDEVQVLVAAGYAVVHGNPRGSAGYGRAHGRAVRRALGTVDAEDVLDLLEGALAAEPRLDPARLGIMGGSYGGYLTARIIAQDHRFRGAIVERGFLDPLSFQGTSDIGSWFGDEYVGTSAEDIARQSALAVADRVRTPTLVIHSEQDLRCPLEQGTRYYTALKRAGVTTEMLIFPGEDHELTRTGRPRHRMERSEAIQAWWERILSASPSPS